jgi:hypothetical protein
VVPLGQHLHDLVFVRAAIEHGQGLLDSSVRHAQLFQLLDELGVLLVRLRGGWLLRLCGLGWLCGGLRLEL